jgi:uncharacterized protein
MKSFSTLFPMRAAIKIIVGFLVLMQMFVLPPAPPTISNAQSDDSTASAISVTGSAEVKVVPDEVIMLLGIETSDRDLLTAKKENDTRIQRVIRVLTENGVETKYIQTDYLHIEPRYQNTYEQQTFLGYWVRKSVSLTLKDVSKFETILTGVLEAGTNYVQRIEFRTTELRKHRDTARSLAIRAAKEKAEALAAEVGLKVTQAINISEGNSGWYSPYGSWWGGGYGGPSQNVVQNTAGASDSAGDENSSLALGQISVSAQVTVTFKLIPNTP